MSLTRYQFEVLAYIEKNGSQPYAIRDLSDSLCISGTEISRCLDQMKAEGNLLERGDKISITESGLQALEPYRVKKAIILAAGFGSRMAPATNDKPKPMVEIHGTRIIDTLLDALIAAGIDDITLVRGYQKAKLDELLKKYPDLKLVDNDKYDSTNNISSAIMVLDEIRDGCYFCEADLYISNPDLITKYQYASNILGSYSLETDDWSFRLEDGHICQYQKGNTYCYNYYGISYWTPEDCDKLRRDFKEVWEEPGGADYFWEFIPLVLRKENYAVEIRQCRKQDIIEIDNFYELVQLDPSYNDAIMQ